MDVTIDASQEDQRELLAEIERRSELGRIEREHAIMKQAIRRSQHYLGLVLQPGGLSSRECITGLLQALGNDEIYEAVHRQLIDHRLPEHWYEILKSVFGLPRQAIHIRMANPDDFLTLCQLDSFALEHPRRREEIATWVNDGACQLAEVNGQVTAYAVLSKHFFGEFLVELLMVGSQFRGRGCGLALIQHLQSECIGAKLFSSTNMSNRPMQELLLKAGFKPSGYINNLDEDDPELVFFWNA